MTTITEDDEFDLTELMRYFMNMEDIEASLLSGYLTEDHNINGKIRILKIMKRMCNESNYIDINEKYQILSSLKTTGMRSMNRNMLNKDIGSGFAYIGAGSGRKYVCKICGDKCGKNNSDKHRLNCPREEINYGCENCGLDSIHPYIVNNGEIEKFCPLEKIQCEMCDEMVMKMEYVSYHKQMCHFESKILCSKKFPENLIDEHMQKIMDFKTFTDQWIDKIVKEYLCVYEHTVYPEFQNILLTEGYHNSDILYVMHLIKSGDPEFVHINPIKLDKICVNDAEENIDEVHSILLKYNLLGGVKIENYDEKCNQFYRQKLFNVHVVTSLFNFTIKCIFVKLNDESGFLLLNHERGEYDDNCLHWHLNSIQKIMPVKIIKHNT
jgi:hypothetical protein